MSQIQRQLLEDMARGAKLVRNSHTGDLWLKHSDATLERVKESTVDALLKLNRLHLRPLVGEYILTAQA